ncbi:4-hydroxybenzoate 3-monooxygenase [Streptomyces noursei ZPM]|uniref:4-hydroxybenzoate 3-monooxygenase n=1 Tax=Streptomyces noursei TaxID=1971 RepID=A0A401QX85_STRNR|nr:4-hydroxybenzoate 3-monooxygenase [Streptomyces noursei]AKA02630.1 4-hydroxybenzoate 3-monooxygenase [Streptomyces noursei ZPM]EOT00790.1 4-hydroxybenzoate 3-monooxygenase [Streptomyces noursei CCRC 11814]EXU90543.1 4-hydroxybenzoate 3-monooxygenase [Streptomyces noursei PD-1]UWS71136.1 4-hydroxybenzoate 3-monooxygenase [Streptomyces noursei]GCB89922.1 4-hydroxybenzoate 3-monooxygenase [Streptomyces noursei]
MSSPSPSPAASPTDRADVVVIGAGPAGLTVANVLRAAGVDCLVLEAESREFVERRPRAGFVEEWAVRALGRHGLAERLWERAETQGEFEFRVDGARHTVRTARLSGRRHFVYPQPLLVGDLLAAYADRSGGAVRFEVRDVRLHDLDGPRAAVSYRDPHTGERHRIACDHVVGADGARGVSRAAIPDGRVRMTRHDHGVAWLAVLAEAPPSADGVVFGIHPRGFGAHMARSARVTRYYLEVPAGDAAADWPDERVWGELRVRLAADGARPLHEGPLSEKTVLAMHNYVVEPMAYGRLHLAGDAAHLLAPIAAKGMNLAINDALLLGGALIAHYKGDDGPLAGYSAAALRRVWQYLEFSQWLSEVLHGASSGDRFRAGTAAARLRRLLGSEAAAKAFAGLYLGEEADL